MDPIMDPMDLKSINVYLLQVEGSLRNVLDLLNQVPQPLVERSDEHGSYLIRGLDTTITITTLNTLISTVARACQDISDLSLLGQLIAEIDMIKKRFNL